MFSFFFCFYHETERLKRIKILSIILKFLNYLVSNLAVRFLFDNRATLLSALRHRRHSHSEKKYIKDPGFSSRVYYLTILLTGMMLFECL